MADERRISLELFSLIKPTCVEISRIATLESDDFENALNALVHDLATLCSHLDQHREHSQDQYRLAPKLADYVFFPITGLLKQKSLSIDATKHVLHVIGFLLLHSWLHEINEALLDQLSPVIVYLCGGLEQSSFDTPLKDRSLEFKQEATYCLTHLIHCFPRTYYAKEDKKRLSLLGDITTILLDILTSIPLPLEQDGNVVAVDILRSLNWLYSTRTSAEQASFVFPGIVSKVINFVIMSRNLHIETLKQVLDLLKASIVKVFSDSDLRAEFMESTEDFSSISSLRDFFEDQSTPKAAIHSVKIATGTDTTTHRTKAWHAATSKQLKIALITLFKYSLITSSIKDKVRLHKSLQNSFFAFIEDVTMNCSRALFQDIIPIFTDIIPLLISCIGNSDLYNADEYHDKGSALLLLNDRTYLSYFKDLLEKKADDIISNHLDRALISADDEKLELTLVALRFHLHILSELVRRLHAQENDQLERKMMALSTLFRGITDRFHYNRTTVGEASSKLKELDTIDENSIGEELNKLDSIILPLHINAKSVTKVRAGRIKQRASNSSDLVLLSKSLDKLVDGLRHDPIYLFEGSFSHKAEDSLHEFLVYVGRSSKVLPIIEMLLSKVESMESDAEQGMGVFLWISNILLQHLVKRNGLKDISTFVNVFDDDVENDDNAAEAAYIILDLAQDALEDDPENKLQAVKASTSHLLSLSDLKYAMSIQTLGSLSKMLSKEDFQRDVLMDHLYTLLQALTYPSDHMIHRMAKSSLNAIALEHYGGSVARLINQNTDYLMDKISISLSVSSGLTPSLPGILLVVLKISGDDLVNSNQLRDVLSEIFLVVDAFHGYSVLMENFFIIFEEVVALMKKKYAKELNDRNKIILSTPVRRFRPWGITNRDEFLDLIDEKNKQTDPFTDYDPQKEYFKRKPGIPFGDQAPDSDDDSDDEGTSLLPEEDRIWPSPIPEDSYKIVLQIFMYGLQLLTHPSIKLRLIILKLFKDAYGIVASNYEKLMPVLAEFWPIILSIIAGTQTISEWEYGVATHQPQLVESALKFAIRVFQEDARHNAFMSRRFLDTWEYLRKHNRLFSSSRQSHESMDIEVSTVTPTIIGSYAELLLTGLSQYERQIPHQAALAMVQWCIKSGTDETRFQLSRDVKNAFWVSRTYG